MPYQEVLGIRYNNVSMDEAVRDILKMASGGGTRYVVTPNPEISESAVKNLRLKQAIMEADYVLPDGVGVIMASRLLGRPLKERVGGFYLAERLLPCIEKQSLCLCLLGAKPGIAQMAAENIRRDYPAIRIEVAHHGYFDNDDEVIAKINAIHPDILFVALGSPRQEIWMYDNRGRIRAGVMIGLGGSLDVFAGAVRRTPAPFVKWNVEWLYRLLSQPSRFIRMLKLPKYLIRAVFVRVFANKTAG